MKREKKRAREEMRKGPVTMAVRLIASIPSATCSAVEADPNPLDPGHPVTSEKMPISEHHQPRERGKAHFRVPHGAPFKIRRQREERRAKEVGKEGS